jgi:uncharacterized membrane protein
MEFSFRTVTLFLAIITTALSAGFFYAWTVSVIPGLKNVSDRNYLETMQSINKAVLNPAFFIVFFGCLVFLIASAYFQYQVNERLVLSLIISAIILYALGTFAVTAFGNVPMNEALDKIDLVSLTDSELHSLRESYESKWNRFNLIRTVFALLSFISVLLASFLSDTVSKSI